MFIKCRMVTPDRQLISIAVLNVHAIRHADPVQKPGDSKETEPTSVLQYGWGHEVQVFGSVDDLETTCMIARATVAGLEQACREEEPKPVSQHAVQATQAPQLPFGAQSPGRMTDRELNDLWLKIVQLMRRQELNSALAMSEELRRQGHYCSYSIANRLLRLHPKTVEQLGRCGPWRLRDFASNGAAKQ